MASNDRARSGIDLVAVLLITRSRPGPKLVFHYPAWPEYRADTPSARGRTGDSDSESEVESDRPVGRRLRRNTATPLDPSLAGPSLHDRHHSPLSHVLGHAVEALEKLLSPGRWSDRKKFEVCLDGVTFVGHPVYALEDGRWSEKSANDAKHQSHYRIRDRDSKDIASISGDPSDRSMHDFTHIPESLDSQADFGLGASTDSNSTTSAAVIEQMTMFHVVFALRTSDHEHPHSHVTAIYRDVAKKFSKALHYCQRQTNYVASESQKLLSMIAKSRQLQLSFDALWTELTESSELAWALKEIHEKISRDSLATLRLSGTELTLHATPRDPTQPGHHHLGPFSALLLLEPKDSLLRSISHQPDASPLAHFIREQTPTKNLHKHSANLSMPLSDVLYLAHHLIKWRKARPISPLHQRNTYVLNPDLDPSALPALTASHRDSFPTLPSLPHILKFLGGAKPIKYGVLIPSRDHRGPYMEILAFLVRHGLVAQLRTFGWLRLPPHTKKSPGRVRHLPRTPASLLRSRDRGGSGSSGANGSDNGGGASQSLLSPHLRPSRDAAPGNSDDDALSVSSEITAIPSGAWGPRPRKAARAGSGVSPRPGSSRDDGSPRSGRTGRFRREDGSTSGDDRGSAFSETGKGAGAGAEGEEGGAGELLLDPARPTPEQRARVARLRAGFADAELREKFEALLPFLDGRHALEEIAARLGVKRARVEDWVSEGERGGWLMVVRHI